MNAKVAQVVADGPRVAILNPLRCATLFSALLTRVFAFQVRILKFRRAVDDSADNLRFFVFSFGIDIALT